MIAEVQKFGKEDKMLLLIEWAETTLKVQEVAQDEDKTRNSFQGSKDGAMVDGLGMWADADSGEPKL